MDLQHDQITVRELMEDSRSRALLQKRFGQWMKHPLFGAAQTLTLEQLTQMARVYLPRKVVDSTLEELRRL